MKVLVLSPFPLDWERAHGGVESTVMYFLDGAAARGDVNLHVVTSLSSVRSPQTRERGPVRITYLPRLRWGRVAGYAGDFRAIRRVVEQEQPDIVHGQGTTFYAGAALASG
ncbi:MAG: glycosyltransferase family 4 protein, partial [Anaerolineae bacterium]